MAGSHTPLVAEVDDALPIDAVKWSFVRRRTIGELRALGYYEVAPTPLELRGTHMLAGGSAWPVGEDLELRSDPVVSLAQLYAKQRHDARHPALERWLLADVVFDPAAQPPHDQQAWHAVASALFGVSGIGAEIEVLMLAQRIAADLGMRDPSLSVALGDDARATELRIALGALAVAYHDKDGTGAFAFELHALDHDGDRLVVAHGGRRDGLLAALGEAHAPLVAFTLGVRRSARCMPGLSETYDTAAEAFFCVEDHDSRLAALRIAAHERARGLRVEVELRDAPLDEQLARAHKVRARAIVHFLADGTVTLLGDQPQTIPRDALSSALRRILR